MDPAAQHAAAQQAQHDAAEHASAQRADHGGAQLAAVQNASAQHAAVQHGMAQRAQHGTAQQAEHAVAQPMQVPVAPRQALADFKASGTLSVLPPPQPSVPSQPPALLQPPPLPRSLAQSPEAMLLDPVWTVPLPSFGAISPQEVLPSSLKVCIPRRV